jgi:DNA-binding NtrC family response regulator
VGLLRSPLPGNVRELGNILRMAIAASGGHRPLRWPSRLSRPPPASVAPPPPPPVPPAEPSEPDIAALKEGLRATPLPSEQRLRQLLEDNDWCYARVAELLGVHVDKLYRLRIKLNMHKPG